MCVCMRLICYGDIFFMSTRNCAVSKADWSSYFNDAPITLSTASPSPVTICYNFLQATLDSIP